MSRISICKLQTQAAIEAIASKSEVFYKSGVWNDYEKKPFDYVAERIARCSYGADVYLDEDTGDFYVCTPVSADMW